MNRAQRTGCCVALCVCAATALGQQPTPIADRVEQPLLPGGISQLAVSLNGELAYFFTEDDATEVVHLIGDFSLILGEGEAQRLRAKEAVVWLFNREYEGRAYRHYQIMLWRDAEVLEIGNTITSGPALFVTLNSFGTLTANADNITYESSADSQVYQDGNAIRKALAEGALPGRDEDEPLRVYDASGLSGESPGKVSRPVIYFQSEGDIEGPMPYGDQDVVTVIGGIYLSRGVPGAGDYLEIRADAVVVFIPPTEREPRQARPQAGLGATPPEDPLAPVDRSAGPIPRARRRSINRQIMSAGFGDVEVEAVYLEGDVMMSQGPNMIRASRLYYDFVQERAVILDAVVRTLLVDRNIPLYLRASEVRQLSARQFSASDAVLTTSEFYTPHYHIGASKVDLTNLTPAEPSGRQIGIRAGSFQIRDATLNVGGRPIGYWPYLRGNLDTSETAIKSLRASFSDDFGAGLETQWHLFNVLGLVTPDGFDATLNLGYFSERGPFVGIDAEYERERYFGVFRGHVMTDDGEDNLGRDREPTSPHDVRGRLLLRHRQYLEDDWQLSLEVSYISDDAFLEEFFESEFDDDKDQETLLYLKKQRDDWAVTALLQTRILDFTTQTERSPDLAFFVVGRSLGDRATWYSENRAGVVRHRGADQSFRELLRQGRKIGSGAVMRVDSRQEISMPFDVGAARVVPFATVRGTAWDDSVEEGGLSRAMGVVGIRASMYLTRFFPNIRSTLFDIDGVRHIVKPTLVAWISEMNVDSHELFPFDQTVEGITDADGATFGIRSRLQTKRGRGDNRRIVDFLTLDVKSGVFNDADPDVETNGFASFSRPENSIAHNFYNASLIWRINDRTALLSELNYDTNDGEIDVLNFSLAVERSPRLSYLLGYRFIEESNSNLLGFDVNYRLTEKHTVAVRERFDLARGRTLDFTVALIRKLPRWFGAISFRLDEAEDDFGVSFSLWPEGLPRVTLGSRRFTGLTNTANIIGR